MFHYYGCVVVDPFPKSVTVTRIVFWRNGRGFGVDTNFSSQMDMEQQVNGDRMEADHRRLDYRIFTDNKEVTLLPHKRDTEVPDNPGTDIRDRPDMSDSQREDWLLQTEPLQGARPRQTDRERPPVINDRSGVLDLEAAGVWGAGRWIKMDWFIADHSSCELQRHLDSVPPETPIRDVVDRCRIWESHANPAVRRVSKPGWIRFIQLM